MRGEYRLLITIDRVRGRIYIQPVEVRAKVDIPVHLANPAASSVWISPNLSTSERAGRLAPTLASFTRVCPESSVGLARADYASSM